MSLRLKTILGVAFIEAMLLIILLSTVLSHMRTASEEGLIEYAVATSTLFATTTKDAVISFDLASIETFVDEVVKNKDIMYARVLDANNNVLGQRTHVDYTPLPFQEDMNIANVSDQVYDTYTSIQEGGTKYGRVEIGVSTTRIAEQLRATRNLGTTIALIEMSIVMLYSFFLGLYLTKQLDALRMGAREIRKGNFKHRIKVVSKDEIAEVAHSFNRMSKALLTTARARAKYQKELKTLNLELEERVEHRTAQIQRKSQELEKAYNKLEKAKDQLVQSEKMASVGQLAAGVAHEINNPIGFVSSNIATLNDYLKNYKAIIARFETFIDIPTKSPEYEKAKEQLKADLEQENIEEMNTDVDEMIHDSIDGIGRVTTIIKSLKTFSHVDQAQIQDTDLNQCLEATLKIVHNELKYKCDVVTQLEPLPLLHCNAGQLNQVFMNLLVNAGHAIEGEKGTVTVRSKATKKAIIISVSDTGKGIPKENLHKLFDPFFTTKPVGQGTGLGLSISHGIISDHKGHIDVESTIGQGTTFTLTLPLKNDLS